MITLEVVWKQEIYPGPLLWLRLWIVNWGLDCGATVAAAPASAQSPWSPSKGLPRPIEDVGPIPYTVNI